jgi:hypothetical protein
MVAVSSFATGSGTTLERAVVAARGATCGTRKWLAGLARAAVEEPLGLSFADAQGAASRAREAAG